MVKEFTRGELVYWNDLIPQEREFGLVLNPIPELDRIVIFWFKSKETTRTLINAPALKRFQ